MYWKWWSRRLNALPHSDSQLLPRTVTKHFLSSHLNFRLPSLELVIFVYLNTNFHGPGFFPYMEFRWRRALS